MEKMTQSTTRPLKRIPEPPTEDISVYARMMEEMAGKDKSEHGKRIPGEKCKYEMSWED